MCKYEIVKDKDDYHLPINVFIHSVNEFALHWHNEIELIYMLEGSVSVTIGKETFILREGDVIFVNSKEVHSSKKTDDSNKFLTLQIDPKFYNYCFPKFKDMGFKYISIYDKDNGKNEFNVIRNYIADIIWCLIKKDKGYELKIGSYLYMIGEHLLSNIHYENIEDKSQNHKYSDIIRINIIMDYINENMCRNITLKEVADKYHLNYYFLSHFIKDKIGMSFQEYLNKIRLEKAKSMIVNSCHNMTEIAFLNGFSSTSYFYKLFKKEYNCLPIEYRKRSINNNKCLKIHSDNKNKIYLDDADIKVAFKKLYPYITIPIKRDGVGIINMPKVEIKRLCS
ncbi:AraC family transcriptional regulator [Metaclostridioides mangenotii]|uniref:AraC family transcriptional regulator n=1 Tax=Metaclostridioides mangenotii TaxID=1540 RepID=UPI000480A744|nr:AraC family transcriptional regulator [Clostridioides mangenotii]